MRLAVLCALVGLVAACSKKGGDPEIVFKTNKGDIVVRLFADKAPLSTQNMLGYVDDGFYDGTTFHRVIGNFMIQGGGFTADLNRKPTKDPIKNEAANGLSNKRGTVAMARTSVVDSATSQFFINVVDNTRLDYVGATPRDFGYAVIGEVVQGMEVVDAIRAVDTCPGPAPACAGKTLPPGMSNVPAEPVAIEKATRR